MSNVTAVASSASSPFAPSISKTYGALLIGTFISLILYGWVLNQCYRYFRTYLEDRLIIKSLVTAIVVLETFNAVLYIDFCFHYLVSEYASQLAFSESAWSFNLLGISTVAVAFVCELFYLRRVYLINNKFQPLVAVAAMFILAELAIAILSTVLSFAGNTSSWMNSAGVGSAVVADTLLAAALILWLHKSRTGIKQTDSLIDRLILYTVNTGFLIGIFNILSLIFALALPDNLIYVAIDLVTTMLYANSVLAVLNARGDTLILPTGRIIDTDAINMTVLSSGRRASVLPSGLPNVRKTIEIVVAKEVASSGDSMYEESPSVCVAV